MDHLTEKKDALVAIFFKRAIADLNGVFNAVAKAEMSCEVKNDGSKIQNRR